MELKGVKIQPAEGRLGVLHRSVVYALKEDLQDIHPMRGVFDQNYVKRLNGTAVKDGASKMDMAEQLIEDIAEFKRAHRCDRLVMLWCASTETFMEPER